MRSRVPASPGCCRGLEPVPGQICVVFDQGADLIKHAQPQRGLDAAALGGALEPVGR